MQQPLQWSGSVLVGGGDLERGKRLDLEHKRNFFLTTQRGCPDIQTFSVTDSLVICL